MSEIGFPQISGPGLTHADGSSALVAGERCEYREEIASRHRCFAHSTPARIPRREELCIIDGRR